MESEHSQRPIPWTSIGVTVVGVLIAVAVYVLTGRHIAGFGIGPDIGGGCIVVFGCLVALGGLATALINFSVGLIARRRG